MIKTIIIDDEQKAREAITDLLAAYCPNVKVIAQAENVETGVAAIKQNKPDLVLLDINMPDGTGFDVLKKLDTIQFKVVFITAYEEYAIKAIKFSALDYIVKPIDPDELVQAIEKVEHSIEKDNINLKLNAFLSNMEHINKGAKKIVLKTSESMHIVNVQDIIRCEADGNYTRFFLIDGKKLIVSRVLKEFDEMLEEYGFCRTHQSHLININHIERFDKRDGGSVVMKDGTEVPVSSRKREVLIGLFEKM